MSKLHFLNDADKRTCKAQANLYKYMAEKGYDIEVFSNEFLNSNVCNKEIDAEYSPLQWEFPNTIKHFTDEEFGNKLTKSDSIDEYADYVGYMYRMLHFETGLSSKELGKKISYAELRKECQRLDFITYEELLNNLLEKYNFKDTKSMER